MGIAVRDPNTAPVAWRRSALPSSVLKPLLRSVLEAVRTHPLQTPALLAAAAAVARLALAPKGMRRPTGPVTIF
jgi:hypothetical protein